ncbi:TetR/AcrR family transcriptional regulator [Streptacidiphilus monticola]
MGRPARGQALLSRERIGAAALALVDEHGPEGLTMRALAERLGVKAASLYGHVQGKDQLLDLLSELVNDEIDLAPLEDSDWSRGLTAYAHGYRAVFLRHPNTIALLARRRVAAERALAGYDAVLALLARAGLAPEHAAEVAAVLDYLVLGSALETFTAGFTRPRPSTPPVPLPGHRPRRGDCRRHRPDRPRRPRLLLGLAYLLTGIEARASRADQGAGMLPS